MLILLMLSISFFSFVIMSMYLKLAELPVQRIWIEVILKLDVTGIE